jgi:chemotaxis protein MotB
MKNKGSNEAPVDPTGWMVTFGDLLMLLLTFFVLLLSMSSMDIKMLKTAFSIFLDVGGVLEMSDLGKVRAVDDFMSDRAKQFGASSVDEQGGAGALKGGDLKAVDILKDRTLSMAAKKKGTKVTSSEALAEFFFPSDDGVEAEMLKRFKSIINISEDERGIIITLGDRILFEPGKAEIRPTMYPILDSVTNVLSAVSNGILVMGHTDNVPTRSERYRSNWELSLHRALNVHHYFVEKKGLAPEQLFVGGYGDLRPLFPNDTREGMENNRRVEIVLKRA